jgi:hypothetical protein
MNFFIPGEMTTLNDYIAAMGSSRYAGADIKKMETLRVKSACQDMPVITRYPIDVDITWYRVNKKSDPDNIAFATKFLFDGMQLAGILRQDSWKHIHSIYHHFAIDKGNPGVEVVLK